MKNFLLILITHVFYLGLAATYAPHVMAAVKPEARASINYYVSVHGDDKQSGLSPGEAWRSLQPINSMDIHDQVNILLEAGQSFEGPLKFDAQDSRDDDRYIRVSSFGNGRASIVAPAGEAGITAYNIGNISIEHLQLHGADVASREAGISFFNDLDGNVKLRNIIIKNVEVSGFRNGISIRAYNQLSGFERVRVESSHLHHNKAAGLEVWGYTDAELIGYAHRDFYVAGNTVHNNHGDPEYFANHSGNGIVVGNIERSLLEYNLAYENGGENHNSGGGPVGIWAWDCSRVTIQFNVSHHNRTGNYADGGGFDLDGGCQDSVMQYNFSHDNDGAGYLMGQYEGARPMKNNILRYNLSVNDGRRNSLYGGITLFRLGDTTFSGAAIYQNTVYIEPSSTGQPVAFSSISDGIENVVVANNIFVTTGTVPLLSLEQGFDATFVGNNYFNTEGSPRFDDQGKIFTSLENWRLGTQREMWNGQPSGHAWEPGFSVKLPMEPKSRTTPTSYQLSKLSPLINAGVALEALQLPRVNRDFFGHKIDETTSPPDPGFYEAPMVDSSSAK
ncbi:MAG TPA: right-handed parallel beta-helix repeat-containing protein [Oligoflexus sp.]|uniref:right-handed parallel beta-helix repeat-containing protein n=1 Tax=Oligoflexus sp. TaxID=1971216 RepID=UPI002D646C28|nr:right-handed parallel beta-helix repeat-containing protein [Oligoflexus sp.]HYX35187.1 right-handed parallel beta-helix repeat-containing protein [Oligoflexus sp.]